MNLLYQHLALRWATNDVMSTSLVELRKRQAGAYRSRSLYTATVVLVRRMAVTVNDMVAATGFAVVGVEQMEATSKDTTREIWSRVDNVRIMRRKNGRNTCFSGYFSL